MNFEPRLTWCKRDGIGILSDESAFAAGLLLAFTNRHGGVSTPPFDSLNLAARVGDDPEAVQENRVRTARAVGFDNDCLALSRQVHGSELTEVEPGDAGVVGEADGLVLRHSGPVAAILTADCAPVVVWGEHGAAVLHGGWRGLAAGVIDAGVAAVQASHAWIGPCIGACCYEVGSEVIDAFQARGLPVAGANHVDPAAAAEAALTEAGVKKVGVASVCTACDPAYYSYRRDGLTGRQGAFVALLQR
jgi:YfiH family protein